jgi:uncharacterized protein (TIGR02266 family)
VEQEPHEFITPEIERRQHRRVRLVAQVKCEGLSREDILVTRDVSAGGMFIVAKEPLPMGSEVALSFRLGATDPLVSCRGKVVYSGTGLGMGIEFIDLNEETRRALQKFVDEAN